jgi:hypothetical protein
MGIPFYNPTPSPPNAFKGVPLPRNDASWLSTLFLHWITPILRVGYSRPLEAEGEQIGANESRADSQICGICQRICSAKRYVYLHMSIEADDLTPSKLANSLDANLQKRMPPSRRRNREPGGTRLGELGGKFQPPEGLSKRKGKKLADDKIAIEGDKTYDLSLWKAIYLTVWRQWWFAALLNGLGSE